MTSNKDAQQCPMCKDTGKRRAGWDENPYEVDCDHDASEKPALWHGRSEQNKDALEALVIIDRLLPGYQTAKDILRAALREHSDERARLREALEQAEYALERAVCWKPPSSSQRDIENAAIKAIKEALKGKEE